MLTSMLSLMLSLLLSDYVLDVALIYFKVIFMSKPNAIVVKLVVSCVKLLAGFVTIFDECLEDLPKNTNNYPPMT